MITISGAEFKQLANFIEQNYGIHLTEKKQTMVVGRLHQVLEQNNIYNFTDYYEYLINDKSGTAVTTLIEKITTNHTFFMRENHHFQYFSDVVLPYLVKTITDKDLRIWSAGCSSGEEPYTLAMLISDYFNSVKLFWETGVLATDLSTAVLQKAAKGIYDAEQLISLPDHWKKIYFQHLNADSRILVDKIRNNVTFRRFNLMEAVFPFKKQFHVIFCRNVMIYFDQPTKNKLLNKFYNCLAPGGYLFIGHSESIPRDETKFKYIMPAVYRKE